MNQTVTLTAEEAKDLIHKGEAPDNLKVQGNLDLHGSRPTWKIPRLPAGLHVEGTCAQRGARTLAIRGWRY
jgi:hypothetical protein